MDHPQPAATNVFTIPLPTKDLVVVPEILGNGQPIFIVERGPQVTAFSAVSSDQPFGIHYLVSWCGSSQTFVDLFHGAEFTPRGLKFEGPGGSSLQPYAVDRIPGMPNQVHVGSPTWLFAGGSANKFQPKGPLCQEASQALLPEIPRPVNEGLPKVASPGTLLSIRG